MTIIDMRCRPAFLHVFFGKTPGTPEYDVVRWLNRRVGTKRGSEHFTKSAMPEGFVAKVRYAGLTKPVVVGRHTPNQNLPNDTIHQIVSAEPVFLGVGSVNPIGQGGQAALDEAERAIRTLGLKGIDVEPGFGSPPRHPDDPAYFPVCELLQSLKRERAGFHHERADHPGPAFQRSVGACQGRAKFSTFEERSLLWVPA